MTENEFDVVIVGAGVSGLTAAALLTRAGLKVCVLEKHRIIGGYLQGFERKGFTFDTAIHWLNQYNENGTVTSVFKLFGDDFPRPLQMKNIHRHFVEGYKYLLTNNPDELKAQLIKDFPHEQKGIEKFFKAAKRVAKVSMKFPKFFLSTDVRSKWTLPFFKLKQLGIIYPLIPYALSGSGKGVEKALRKFFTDPELLGIFRSEQDLLSCLFPIAWAYNDDYQNPPIGGSQVIPAWLKSKIKDNGSEVILSADVFKINIEDNTFKSVTYRKRLKEYEVKAKYMIAACDVDAVYKKFLPKESVPKIYTERIDAAEMYSSSVTISVALKCSAESLGFGDELLHMYNEETDRLEHSSGDPYASFISILAPTTRDKTLAPEGHGTLNIFVPAWMNYKDNWGTALNGKGEYDRNEAYKQIKEEFAQIIFERIEDKLCPNLREHILFYEVATPITYYRYTHNKDGTMMGTRPGKKNMQLKVSHYRSPVNNLIIGSHWSELGGGVPIAVKAAYNASAIVLKETNRKAFKELVNYMR
jgi:prolycopene isomerase